MPVSFHINSYMRYSDLNKKYGSSITFVDLDETLFKTYAKILVRKDGQVVKELTNQEFNTYRLGPGEEYDYSQFKNAQFFKNTSKPIQKVIDKIQGMLLNIQKSSRTAYIVILTARSDFDDRDIFLQKLNDSGLDMSKIYVERSGNLQLGAAQGKVKTILDYLQSGEFTRVRLIDDAVSNLDAFLNLYDTVPQDILAKIREYNQIPSDVIPLKFEALLVKEDGSTEVYKR